MISGVISPLIWVISVLTLLIALLISAHEPPSKLCENCNPHAAGDQVA